MLRFVVFTALAALVLAEEDVTVRVVGGEEVKPHSWPWQISLQIETNHGLRHICGGTLIRPTWVMTAAHCVEDNTPRHVVVGKHNLTIEESTEQYLNVSHIFVHPQWNTTRTSDGFDIALLKLSSAAELNDNVKLATLPPSGQILHNTTDCYTTGWGYTKAFGRVKDVLLEARLPLVDYKQCSSQGWWFHTVKQSMICAGGDGVHSSCQGDSGGPLNCKVDDHWVVHGITSFGSIFCNFKHKPSVYTRVSDYISWINGTITNN